MKAELSLVDESSMTMLSVGGGPQAVAHRLWHACRMRLVAAAVAVPHLGGNDLRLLLLAGGTNGMDVCRDFFDCRTKESRLEARRRHDTRLPFLWHAVTEIYTRVGFQTLGMVNR